MHALISIHDVMPETIDKVADILDTLPEPCLENLVLLIVPGRNWQPQQIERLRQWQQSGLILAGHGWVHEAEKLNGFYHKLHSFFISRNAAEHLALSQAKILELMKRNYDWFIKNDLESPDYYVPPAWALGFVDRSKLQTTPFCYIENTLGIIALSDNRIKGLPLCGFEADTTFRKIFLTVWNNFQKLCSTKKYPLRISIHPNDFELLLNKQLNSFLQQVTKARHYQSL